VWEVEFTDEFEIWWDSLQPNEQEAIVAAVEFLEEKGPALRRPFVDVIRQSRHANMKELIPMGSLAARRYFSSAETRPTAGPSGTRR
jgi:hypothetical protein